MALDRRTLLKTAATTAVLAAPLWYADPKEDVIGILMTQRLFDPTFLAIHTDFWTSAYRAIDA